MLTEGKWQHEIHSKKTIVMGVLRSLLRSHTEPQNLEISLIVFTGMS